MRRPALRAHPGRKPRQRTPAHLGAAHAPGRHHDPARPLGERQDPRSQGPGRGPDALAAAAAPGRSRIIWDAEGGWEISGIDRVRDEDDGPTGDPAVDEAFEGFGVTFDFWQTVFSRDSIDNEDMPMRGVVHFGQDYPNAFWDGRRMVFGDGDDEIFVRFTSHST